MTISELWQLVKRFWVLVVAIPIVFASAYALYAFIIAPTPASYTATATVVPNSQGQAVAGLAVSESSSINGIQSDAAVTVAYDATKTVVSINATGGNADKAAEWANQTALNVIAKAEAFYSDTAQKNVIPFAVEFNEATVVEDADQKKLGFVVGAFLVGLIIALCILVLINMIRRPVLSKQSVEEESGLALFENCPDGEEGKRLLANIRFSLSETANQSICLVPVSDHSHNESVLAALQEAIHAEGSDSLMVAQSLNDDFCGTSNMILIDAKSLVGDIETAYVAEKAGITLLVVRQWADSMKDLEATVSQLRRAHANLVGFVYCTE